MQQMDRRKKTSRQTYYKCQPNSFHILALQLEEVSIQARVKKPKPNSRTMHIHQDVLYTSTMPVLCSDLHNQDSQNLSCLYIHLNILVYPSRRIANRFIMYNKSTRRVLRCKAKALARKIIIRKSIPPTNWITNIVFPSSDSGLVLKIVGGAFDDAIV